MLGLLKSSYGMSSMQPLAGRVSRVLICSGLLLTASAQGQILQSFQKVSSLEGGLTQSGVDLDTRDDFGESIDAIGDLDGDGVIDLVVGAQRDDDGGEDRGAVYILFMNPNGTVDRSQKISDTAGGFTGDLANGDTFGIGSTGIGDLNGDGVLDIAVGASRDDDGGTNTGSVYILFMNTDGTVQSHQKISRTSGGLSLIANNFGQDLENLRDYNNDGFTDLFVRTGGSEFYIITLNSNGTVRDENRITQSNSGSFGNSGALLGDLDQDGIMDIVAGAERDDDGATDAGAVWVLFMNANGTTRARQKISLEQGGFTGFVEAGDQFGQSVSPAGDLNNDGIPDLLVGAENADSPDGSQSNSGELWLLFLNRDGTVQSQEVINEDTENFAFVRRNSNLGQAVTSPGDLNGDGFLDVIGAADGDIDGSGVMTGAFYVFFLNPFNPPAETRFQQSQGSGNLLTVEAENFNANLGGGSHQWVTINSGGAAGGVAMESTPDIGSNIQTNYAQNSPRLDYLVNFATAGTHYVWVRGLAGSGADSVHLGLNGQELTSSRRIQEFQLNTYDWTNQILANNQVQVATIQVPTAGPHTLNAWMREDGFILDRFFLTTDPNFVPTGFGPSESNTQSSGSAAPDVVTPGDQTSLVNTFVSLQIEATDSDAGDTLSYAANGLPAGLSIDSATGLISGFATAIGDFSVLVVVTDSTNAASTTTFDWEILTDNLAPEIANIPNQSVVAGQALSFAISASDDGPGPLVLQAVNLPAGATFADAGNGTGTFSWTPQLQDVVNSPFSVTFEATDDNGNGLTDSQSVNIVVTSPSGGGEVRFVQSSAAGNLLVVEAENFNANVAQGVHRWELNNRNSAGGGSLMESLPNNRTNNSTNYAQASPRLDFDVSFVTTGTHYVWVRGFSANSGNDSVHVGLDGVDLLSSRRVDDFAVGGLDWSGDVQVGPGQLQRAIIEVNGLGNHTLNIWMREDGFEVDRLLVTTDPNFIPSGQGPSESLRQLVGGGGNSAPSIASVADQNTDLNASVSLQINATDGDGDTLAYSATGLPTGLTIDASSGLIGGTPSAAASFTPVISVTDGNGGNANISFSWVIVGAGGAPRFTQSNSTGNLLVVEAENFTANTSQGVHSWEPIQGGGAAGGVSMLATPNIGTNNGVSYASDSPRLDHEVTFVTAGTHYVWIRGLGSNLGNDSVHVGLDGIDLLSSRRVDDFVIGSFDWSGDIQVAPGQLQRATIEIPAAGDYTLNIWMREDGFRVDRLLLTTDPSFTPSNNGPAESPVQ